MHWHEHIVDFLSVFLLQQFFVIVQTHLIIIAIVVLDLISLQGVFGHLRDESPHTLNVIQFVQRIIIPELALFMLGRLLQRRLFCGTQLALGDLLGHNFVGFLLKFWKEFLQFVLVHARENFKFPQNIVHAANDGALFGDPAGLISPNIKLGRGLVGTHGDKESAAFVRPERQTCGFVVLGAGNVTIVHGRRGQLLIGNVQVNQPTEALNFHRQQHRLLLLLDLVVLVRTLLHALVL